jgi:electron transport complex protein RnfD
MMRISSPHAHGPANTSLVMCEVMLATTPGIAALTWFFGFGTLVNITLASFFALACEALFLWLRQRPVLFALKDGSALVTAVLLGIALPPYVPWWVVMLGVMFAIFIAKQLYGGLGYNPFNPAMVAYVVLLISLPVQMTQWAAPSSDGGIPVGLLEAIRNNLGLVPLPDGYTMATPLDLLKQNEGFTVAQLWAANPQFGRFGGTGWEWANLGFLIGGLYLLARRIFTWHAPVSMLATLALCAAIGYDSGSSTSGGSPLFHLFSGATMLGAWFIVTDPVTSATTIRGKLIYGAAIGLLVYLIRVLGNYPDAVAFSVLLLNFAAPLIDHYTQPATYGHAGRKGKAP